MSGPHVSSVLLTGVGVNSCIEATVLHLPRFQDEVLIDVKLCRYPTMASTVSIFHYFYLEKHCQE
jgi:hypothetical protein